MIVTRRQVLAGCMAVGAEAMARPVRSLVGAKHHRMFEEDDWPVSAADYVQNGLVAMYDGIENDGWGIHDASTPMWRNLIGGGYDFSLTARGSFGPDSLICAGTGSACGFADRLSSFISMEAVLRWENILNTYQIAFVVGFNGKTIMRYFNANKSFLAFNSYYQISLGRDAEYLARRHHISVEYAGTSEGAKVVSAVLDGSSAAVVNSTSTGYTVKAGKMVVGGQDDGSTRPFFGEICNLRLYSRALTADEIAHNYAIDKMRFGL